MTATQWLARERAAVAVPLRLAAICGVIEGLLIISQAGLIAWLVYQVVMASTPLSALIIPAFCLLGVVLLRPVFQWLRAKAGITASDRVRRRIRTRLLERIETNGPSGFRDKSRGELASQLTDQINALDGYFARYLPQMTIAIAIPAAIAATAFTQDWLAASFLLLAAPLIPLFMALVGMGAERLNRDQFTALARLSGQFLDRVRGLTTLRLFSRIDDAANGIIEGSDEYRRRSMRVLRVAFLSSAVLEFFASVAIAVIAIYVGFGLLGYIDFGPAPALTLFSGLFVLLLAPEFFQPLRTLAQHYHDRATAIGAADLLMMLDEQSPNQPSDDPMVSAETSNTQGVQIQALAIEREGRGTVLHVPQFKANPSEKVLIEGPSGSGKTTLLLAIAGLLPVTNGKIQLGLGNTRIGWLGSPTFLANASIRENIRLGDPDATDQAIVQASREAGVDEFLDRLPDGLDSVVGERGLSLSGGQAQRVALARALVAKASLVILDEPTNALDAETEAHVLAAIETLASDGSTVIIASHDIALRPHADRIYRISSGQLEAVTDA